MNDPAPDEPGSLTLGDLRDLCEYAAGYGIDDDTLVYVIQSDDPPDVLLRDKGHSITAWQDSLEVLRVQTGWEVVLTSGAPPAPS